jgi:hypothetical protein
MYGLEMETIIAITLACYCYRCDRLALIDGYIDDDMMSVLFLPSPSASYNMRSHSKRKKKLDLMTCVMVVTMVKEVVTIVDCVSI